MTLCGKLFVASALIWAALCSVARATPQVIELWPEGGPELKAGAGEEKDDGNGRFTNIHRPTLTVYAPAPGQANGTAVVCAPGGGYVRVAAGANGGEITRWLNTLGITVFVLKYRNVEYGHPAPLRDALRAVRMVRLRAPEWGLKPGRIGMLGGSAGGHLAATLLTKWDEGNPASPDAVEHQSSRPDLGVLCYPVISMGKSTHSGSRGNLLGPNPSPELMHDLSAELHVTSDTPPCFVWHTYDDGCVPVAHALLFANALHAAKVPFELHIYQDGDHGLGMKDDHPWPAPCLAWLKNRLKVNDARSTKS